MRWSSKLEAKAWHREEEGLKIDLEKLAGDVFTITLMPIYQYERAERFGVTYKKSDATSQGVRGGTASLP